MSEARRQRRAFKRAYDKATKRQATTPVTLQDNAGLQQLINTLIEDHEAKSSSK